MRYQRLVYSIARRGGLDQEMAGEVFQVVFMKLFAHIERIEQPDRIRTWLVTVAQRETWRVRQQVRMAVLQPSIDADEGIHTLPDTTPLPDEIATQIEEQHLVHMAMAKLDDRCRQLLTYLFAPEPIPYVEICDLLGIPLGSIGPTRVRCLQKLRVLLEKMIA